MMTPIKSALPSQCFILFLILGANLVVCDDQASLNRVYSDDVDESSCLCGLSRDILDRLESIVKASQQTTCSIHSTYSTTTGSHKPQLSSNQHNDDRDRQPQPQSQQQQSSNLMLGGGANSKPFDLNLIDKRDPSEQTSTDTGSGDNNNGDSVASNQNGLVGKLTDDIKNLQSQIAQLLAGSNSNNNQPQQQQLKPDSASSSSFSTSFGLPSVSPGSLSSSFQISLPSVSASSSSSNNNDSQDEAAQPAGRPSGRPINSGFLGGFLTTATPATNEALSKLNQSQQVDSSDMQSALELTVPNVVSNIFSNIQNLTIEAEQRNKTADDSNGGAGSGVLTSIDGSSVSVSGSSAAQITAQGEQLFINWIDHQLQSLHLTVSMAAYIRRNALNLFRRIVKQYVERMERIGGRVEDNVRRATQVALNNTQNLCSFLLRYYINFAGGLMKIMGEQVSRVGKQLDSTGETIAHINLNPFDIVSNVIDSLPNPSHYSEYFRAFGKYLMGESSGSSTEQQPTSIGSSSDSNSSSQGRPKGGLFSKTMGALGKTLGSWIG